MQRFAIALGLVGCLGAIARGSTESDALARLREALGGEAALSSVRSIRARSTIARKPYKDHVEVKVELPARFFRTVRYLHVADKSRRSAVDAYTWEPDIRSMGILDTTGSPGETRWGFDGLTPLPVRSPFERRNYTHSDLIPRHALFAEFVLPLLGQSSSVYPVSATSDGHSIVFRGGGARWWQVDLDPATNLPMRMSWTTRTPASTRRPEEQHYWQVDFSEFKNVSGLNWPHRLIKSRNGQVDEDMTIDTYGINVALKFPK